VGVLLAGRLFKYTPELRIGEWRKLDAKHRKLFKDAVVVGDGFPAVSLLEPRP
jgi:hypothetical protein